MSERYVLVNGECLEEMRKMDADSMDAIVTDPPYGLAFMGAKWDSFGKSTGRQTVTERKAEGKRYAEENAGAPRYGNSHGKRVTRDEMVSFQEAMTPIFAEALRVAKPGAYMLCFGGTRTFHRMACAMEDAGWSIRDTIMWVYGCLSEDSDILTPNGWAHCGELKVGDEVVCYDARTDTYRVERVQDTHLYDYDDIAYRIHSDSTDQLVSRNHRVLVERDGMVEFVYAERLAQEQEIRVPVLEGVQDVLDSLSDVQSRTGAKERLLLREVPSAWREGARGAERDMRDVREEVSSASKSSGTNGYPLLLADMQRQGEGDSASGIQQGAPREACEVEGSVRGAGRTAQRGQEPSVEGRCRSGERKDGEINGGQSEMPRRVLGHGAGERVRGTTQTGGRPTNWQEPYGERGRSSRGPQSVEQRTEQSDAIRMQRRPQEVRGNWKTRTTVARIEPVRYSGNVWCVTVPTGAFVARRNGQSFVTGNSGFPHGMDVSKAIDKALGVKSEVIGQAHNSGKGYNKVKGFGSSTALSDDVKHDYDITAPTSEQAKQWSGWNTQLKPAWEPIIVAQKPLDGTVAHNVLTHGVGAMNIDACRVPTEDKLGGGMKGHGGVSGAMDRPWMHDEEHQREFVERKKQNIAKSEELGRYPANLIHDGSEEVVNLFPNTKSATKSRPRNRTPQTNAYGTFNGREGLMTQAYGDNGSAARYFYCAKASKSDRGEGNTHPTCKPTKLMRYLVKLVCPVGGAVLDPFMGSGSTGVAALQEGMRFVGIDMEEEYCEMARKRISEVK